MSESYGGLRERIEQMYVDDIQHDEQGNIIYDELEQRERGGKYWKELEEKYGINFGDVVKLDNHLGRVQELFVSEETKDRNGRTKTEVFGDYVSEESNNNEQIGDSVSMRLYGGTEFEDIRCKEVGMTTAKEFLKSIKVQPQEKEKKLSIKEKIKNTIKTKVQTLKKTLKKGGASERLANRRTHEKATNAQTKPSASQSASQRLKNKRALHNTQGLER
jgi:hypothetical protein